MKFNAPVQLTPSEAAALKRITNRIPRIRIEVPARAEREETAVVEEKDSFLDKFLRRKPKVKAYPY